jgi:GDP-L-fucose synthase
MSKGLSRSGKIFVAGHRGMVGGAILRRLRLAGYRNLVTRTHRGLDLTDQAAVRRFFRRERPDAVFLAAAKVGGIWPNHIYPADFLFENLAIELNVVRSAYESNTRKLLFLGSSCIYPRLAPQPIPEEALLAGPLEPTNEAYAVAKIAGIKLCTTYNRQYGTNFLCVMPTNLYGPGDNYDLKNAHVIPALIRKMHEAKLRGDKQVIVWGSGKPRREFLFSQDLADACVFLMEDYDAAELGDFINVGTGEDLTIAELAQLIARVVGFSGKLVFDPAKPDGTPRKMLDVRRMRALGWKPSTSLADGLQKTYHAFLRHCSG